MRSRRPIVLAVALVLAAVVSAGAQSAPMPAPRDTAAPARPLQANDCVGFSFGGWDPPLASAGAPPKVSAGSGTAAGGRDWASMLPGGPPGAAGAADSVLVLYPAWWPVGVGITWTRQSGDTLFGVAHAFVSDGKLTPPASRVRAWKVACGK